MEINFWAALRDEGTDSSSRLQLSSLEKLFTEASKSLIASIKSPQIKYENDTIYANFLDIESRIITSTPVTNPWACFLEFLQERLVLIEVFGFERFSDTMLRLLDSTITSLDEDVAESVISNSFRVQQYLIDYTDLEVFDLQTAYYNILCECQIRYKKNIWRWR